jgi:hypothetical protein
MPTTPSAQARNLLAAVLVSSLATGCLGVAGAIIDGTEPETCGAAPALEGSIELGTTPPEEHRVAEVTTSFVGSAAADCTPDATFWVDIEGLDCRLEIRVPARAAPLSGGVVEADTVTLFDAAACGASFDVVSSSSPERTSVTWLSTPGDSTATEDCISGSVTVEIDATFERDLGLPLRFEGRLTLDGDQTVVRDDDAGC